MTYNERRIDDWVRHWAGLTPQAEAVRDGSESLTYAELVASAERIAAGLHERGVRPDDIVLVDLPRGAELIEVILAVLRCGAVYSIVDADWPDARYADIAALTGARLCVGDPARPSQVTRIPVKALQGSPPVPFAGKGNACCVFFTSGSTGVPKGVLTGHRAILRVAFDPLLDVGAGHGMLQAAPSPWDAFAMEVWAPLTRGGVTVIHRGRYTGPDDVREAVARGADTMFLTSTLFSAIVDADVQAFAGARTVITGGERVSPAHLRRCRDEVAGVAVHNAYGPVESAIFTTSFPLAGFDEDGDVPIGRPVLATAVHVLDDELRPVPAGVRGEIAISGDGLALEYLGDPEATRAKFPTVDLGGPTRVYLTGDLGSLGTDGLLRIAGRRDRQFKIRGVRVEPAEVEAALQRLPGVGAAAVLPLPYGTGLTSVQRMVACVVSTLDGAAVRTAVAELLPAGYVPDLVVCLSRLPVTANGKADLPELARIASAATTPVAQVEESEETGEVLDIVRELLDVPVGWDTNIFDAGASSITAIRVAHRLGALAGVKVDPARIFHHPTPRDMATLVTAGPGPRRTTRSESRWQAGLPVPQWRFWYLEVRSPGNGDGLTPMQHRIDGPLDADLLAAALRTVIGRHSALRTRLLREGDRGIRPVITAPADVPDVLAVQDCAPDDAQSRAQDFLERPFRLDVDLPIRGLLLRTGPETHLLTFSVHHTAFDGWSGAIFCRELSDAYAGRLAARTPIDYQAAWLAQDLSESPADRDRLRAWTRELDGVPDLPLGKVPDTATGEVGEVWVPVPDGLREAAEQAATAAGGSVQAALLAAWVRALRRFTGADDFAIGIPVAGRTTAAAEDVIGCFTSGVAARFTAVPGAGPATDLRRAAEQLATALRFQYMPIERLLRESEPRTRDRNPFCQAGFVVQNYEAPDLVIDGARCESAVPRHHHSAFELTLELWLDRGLGARIWFRTDVLDDARGRRLGALWLEELAEVAVPVAV
ncbi:AMP-binding protein [Winogradskya humida]|uniref:Amino acid adenylation protein n=1 Tax=Winogradskya humida TaxID=113566 RepID=A0ABQ4A079_9ACTN|nr:AMP-binding protein [Actinoplanes humidus]GIE24276.1 amino acid adenylation protein [Actinoplanes humidus]